MISRNNSPELDRTGRPTAVFWGGLTLIILINVFAIGLTTHLGVYQAIPVLVKAGFFIFPIIVWVGYGLKTLTEIPYHSFHIRWSDADLFGARKLGQITQGEKNFSSLLRKHCIWTGMKG